MGRRCSVCAHPRRKDIDRDLLDAEVSVTDLAARFELSIPATYRHRRNHLPRMLHRVRGASVRDVHGEPDESRSGQLVERPQDGALGAHETRYAIDIVQQLRAINAACLEVLREARTKGQPGLLLQAVDRIARQIELQAKLLGTIDEGTTVNVAVLTEWHGIRQVVLEALRPYPDARLAVVEALQEHAS